MARRRYKGLDGKVQAAGGALLEAKKTLTGSGATENSGRELEALLDEAGLELWQAPEGFWAVRLKPPAAVRGAPRRRARLRHEGAR